MVSGIDDRIDHVVLSHRDLPTEAGSWITPLRWIGEHAMRLRKCRTRQSEPNARAPKKLVNTRFLTKIKKKKIIFYREKIEI